MACSDPRALELLPSFLGPRGPAPLRTTPPKGPAAAKGGREYNELPLEDVSPSTPLRNGAGGRLTLWQRWSDGEFTIVPEKNILMDMWDVIMSLALLATATVLPYEVALLEDPSEGWRCANRCVDLAFLVDIIMAFNVAYPVSSGTAPGAYEKAPRKIARHYMAIPFSDNFEAGWFWPDVLTVFPYDMMARYCAIDAESQKSMRVVSILRLIRMFRLVRVLKLVSRWQAHLGFSFAAFSLAKCLGFVILSLHWLACLWGLVAMVRRKSDRPTWLTRAGEVDNRDPADYTPLQIYNMALYFAAMTLTSVGFGDIRPANDQEVALVTAMMITTGFMWAFVLANTVNIVTNLDTYSSRFHERMDELNLLMQSRNLTPSLRRRLRRYMHESFHVHRQRHQLQTIKWLSGGLQGELAMQSGVDKVCNLVWYLKDLPEAIIVDLACQFISEMYGANEFLQPRIKLFVIRKGTCLRKSDILTRDHVIGEDMILFSDYLRDSCMPRTLTFLEVLSLKRQELFVVAEHHPDFSRRLRSAQIKMAMWRGVVYAARQIQVKGSKWDKLWQDFQEDQGQKAPNIMALPSFAASDSHAGPGYRDDRGERGGLPGAVAELLREVRCLRSLSEAGLQKLDTLGARTEVIEGRLAALERQGGDKKGPVRSFTMGLRPST